MCNEEYCFAKDQSGVVIITLNEKTLEQFQGMIGTVFVQENLVKAVVVSVAIKLVFISLLIFIAIVFLIYHVHGYMISRQSLLKVADNQNLELLQYELEHDNMMYCRGK